MGLRRTIIGILVVTALIAIAAPVLAGGWATVLLDEPPGGVFVEAPWTFGFMVLQHDITPNSDVTPVLRAIHKETAEEVTATGRQEGAVGHFVAEVTFPSAGDWKWSIAPEPYAETSFETLTVLESPSAVAYGANILTGSCAALGNVAFPLGDVAPQTMAVKSTRIPVSVGVSTIDAPLAELVTSGHAIGISTGETDTAPVACGDLAAMASENADELVLGLQDGSNARNIGVAVLRDQGERTEVKLYLLDPNQSAGARDAALAVSEETNTIEILDAWLFLPYSLEIETGATVTWVNSSKAAHTVTGDDLAFDDSGIIEPGASFSLTFDEPGTFNYRCGPHPGMVGMIVVS